MKNVILTITNTTSLAEVVERVRYAAISGALIMWFAFVIWFSLH